MSVNFVKRTLHHKLMEIYRNISAGSDSYDPRDVVREIEDCNRNLQRIRSHVSENDYAIIREAFEQLNNLVAESNDLNAAQFSALTFHRPTAGRPAKLITKEQLELLYSQGYTANKMAKQFKCSVSTVYKRCYEEGIKFRNKYTTISDEELRETVQTLHQKFPNSGSVMMDGYLKADGLVVQRKRIRTILAETDKVGTAKRWSRTIKRRMYRVATPNSLWHMDAHMKLARWGFVTHGCIDGFSRTIIYVSCTTSVTAEVVIKLFIGAVAKYGLPSRVRSDHGFENLFVAILMNSIRGLTRGSHITGKSVHNQRIERLWVDVFQQVISSFYVLFYKMEREGILDPNNTMHRYLLHKVYMKEINENLEQFRRAWNYHKIRTEANRSPHEVWVHGFLSNINSEHTAIQELVNDQEPINDRLINIFEHQYGLNTTAIAEDVNAASRATREVELTREQSLYINNILNNNIASREKYLSCVQYLNII